MRLFPQTYAFLDLLERHYGIAIERVRPDAASVATMVAEHGEHLFFDAPEKQELCCRVRKVLPNEAVLGTLDVWITGLRADQSRARAGTERFSWIPRPGGAHESRILKVAPLADWTEERLQAYARANGVPVHPLLSWRQDGWRYESLGCVICTTPIGPHEPRRAGRWRWFQGGDKECGLHRPPGEAHG